MCLCGADDCPSCGPAQCPGGRLVRTRWGRAWVTDPDALTAADAADEAEAERRAEERADHTCYPYSTASIP